MAYRWSKSSELHEYTGTYHLWASMWVCTLESMHPLEDAANEWYLTFFTFPYEALTHYSAHPLPDPSCPTAGLSSPNEFPAHGAPFSACPHLDLSFVHGMCWLLPSCPLRQPHAHAASPLKPSLRLSRLHSWITRTSPCSDICNGHKFPVHNLRCLRMKLSSHSVMKCDFQSHDPTPIQGGNSVLIQLVFLCPGQALLCLFVIFLPYSSKNCSSSITRWFRGTVACHQASWPEFNPSQRWKQTPVEVIVLWPPHIKAFDPHKHTNTDNT